MAAPFRNTQVGFNWGPVEVERQTIDHDGHHILRVNNLEVHVSPTGRSVRVFKDGNELKYDDGE